VNLPDVGAFAAAVIKRWLTGRVDLIAPPVAAASVCQDRYNRCYGCDPFENECCINCYVACQDGKNECLSGTCGGCWQVII
jgi:hypothetical protein